MGEESGLEDFLEIQVKKVGGQTRKVKWFWRRAAPDRRVMLPPHVGKSCWVELKAPGKKPDEHQLREHKRMRDLGEIVYVIDSRDQIIKLTRMGYV